MEVGKPVGQVPCPGQYTTVTTSSFYKFAIDTFRVILEDTKSMF